MIEEGPFRVAALHDSVKILDTTCLAMHWKILLPKHSSITFCRKNTDSQPLAVTTFYGTQGHQANFFMISKRRNQHFFPTSKPTLELCPMKRTKKAMQRALAEILMGKEKKQQGQGLLLAQDKLLHFSAWAKM
jgi:hypothetical protein